MTPMTTRPGSYLCAVFFTALLCTAVTAEAKGPDEQHVTNPKSKGNTSSPPGLDQGPACGTLVLPKGFRMLMGGAKEKKSFNFSDKTAGGGGTRCSSVVMATAGTVVHRLWGGPAGQFGSFWSEKSYPSSSGRKKMAVCRDWNDMTHSVACSLKRDTQVGVGFSQSVYANPKTGASGCKDPKEMYPASGDLQVFIPAADPSARQALLDCPPKTR